MATYKKIGGGSLRFKNRIIKRNEVFTAEPHEIPEAFEDTIIEVDKKPTRTRASKVSEKQPEKQPEPEAEEKPAVYTKQERENKGWFDVMGEDGKAVNEKGLRETEADELIEQLSE
jgi:hypothetical protein